MNNKTIHVIMLIDAWFPSTQNRRGVYGGGQVHVRELRNNLHKDHPCKIELFYAKNSHILFRSIWAWAVIIKALRYARTHKIDIIHSHGFSAGFSAKVLGTILKKPVVHTVHGSHLMDQGKPTLQTNLEKWLLTGIKYSAEISVGKNFLKYKNVNKNIHVIPNGVDLARFNAVRVAKNTQPTLIWVGRPAAVKGISILKEAIKKVRVKLPTLHTELVTGGRLAGEPLVRAYKKAHVFVLPSLAEGQPITLLEAWAAKFLWQI